MSLRKTKYVPLAKHSFDLLSIRQTQQAVNALLNNEIVVGSKPVGKVHNSDSNTVFELPAPPSVDTIFPFKIYPETNKTATQDQIDLFTTAGLNINNFTVQIRSGVVSGRTYINQILSTSDGDIRSIGGNFEQELYVQCTDSIPTIDGLQFGDEFYYPLGANKNGVTTIIDNSDPTLIYGTLPGSPPGTEITVSAQVALNQNVNDELEDQLTWCAAFWIEIIDDPVFGFYGNLMAQMFAATPLPSSGRTVVPFPAGTNIAPIGILRMAHTGTGNTGPIGQYFEQVQGGNLVNRYPAGTNINRGRWVALYAALTAGKTQINFYPGDIIVDDSAQLIFAGVGYYGVFEMIAPAPISSVVATVPQGSANWQQTGMTPN